MTISERLGGRNNLITPVRLALALTVAAWHAFVIAGAEATEPGLQGLSPSFLAVNGFFVLSGFLIARSAETRNWAYYLAARGLRLFPALIALLAVGGAFAAILHLLAPATPDRPGDWLFGLKALMFMDADGTFPGLFQPNPRQEFSLPLWTLRYEALAYVALPFALALGLVSTAVRAWLVYGLAVVAVGLCSLVEVPAIVADASRLGAAFLLGTAIYQSRRRLSAGWRELGVAAVLAAALYPTPFFEGGFNLVLAWALFAVCFPPAVAEDRAGWLTRLPDYSYGVYIWHWPVFQTIKLAWPGAPVEAMLTLGFALSIAIAAASWRWVERPSLRQKAWLADLLERSLRLAARSVTVRPRPAP